MKQLGQFETYLVHEFVEDYQDGLMTRRDMMRRVLHITGSVVATATILSKLGVLPIVSGAESQEATPAAPTAPQSPISVPADDPRIIGEDITFDGNGATLIAYQARLSSASGTPEASGTFPVVLICHENRGLTDHIRDVARRWAVEGYVACAVDLLSRQGGTASIADQSEIPAMLTSQADSAQQVADFQAASACCSL
jgi:carboxymethylenebutenolidase